VDSARVVLGAVAPVPWRSPAAEAVLKGKPLTEQVAAQAADAAVKNAVPMTQNGYKVQLARTTLMRALMQAARA
jgi:xanthine dehydrogenase YagS FAD-binding subunit